MNSTAEFFGAFANWAIYYNMHVMFYPEDPGYYGVRLFYIGKRRSVTRVVGQVEIDHAHTPAEFAKVIFDELIKELDP